MAGRVLMSPDGSKIVGTLERVPAVANIAADSLKRNAEGEVVYVYEGGTDLTWDEQETVTREGQTVFVDEDGTEWLEGELIETPEESWSCPNCGNTDQDGSDACVDCGQREEEAHAEAS